MSSLELLSLSKFKLQFLSLISETHELRERESSVREELQRVIQRQKQNEAEYARNLQQLNAELALRDEFRRSFETKVKYLENENDLLGKKEKELKAIVDNLLQSRETFVSQYEDSTSSLRCSIEVRDRKLALLLEKIHAHLLLFDSIEKEAAAVKQVVDNVQHLISEKEQAVTELKGKMDMISTFEKDFVEKIVLLENKTTGYQKELRRKDTTISELKEQLRAEKRNTNFQPQIEELRNALLVKEEVIKSLTSEKKALYFELQNMELNLRRIQDTFIKMNMEDQKLIFSVLEGQEVCEMTSREENESSKNTIRETDEHFLGNESRQEEHANALGSCLLKGKDSSLVQHMESECSTTGAEASEGP